MIIIIDSCDIMTAADCVARAGRDPRPARPCTPWQWCGSEKRDSDERPAGSARDSDERPGSAAAGGGHGPGATSVYGTKPEMLT